MINGNPDIKAPRLLRFSVGYERGRGAGRWLAESLNRAALGAPEASASVEFSLDPDRESKALEGPLMGRGARSLAAEFGADLAGAQGLALMEHGLALTARFMAADAEDSALRLLKPAAGGKVKEPALGPMEAVMVLEARPGAVIYYGRRRDLAPERFATMLIKGEGTDMLERHPAESGQVFLAPAGMPYALGRGVMAFTVSLEAAEPKEGKAAGLISSPVLASRLFVKGLGFVEGMNAVTWLWAAGPLAAARLDLRAEWEDEWKGEGARPGFILLTGLFGRGLLTAAGETETMERGKTVLVSAGCRSFRVNPAPEGAAIIKTWLADREAEVMAPLLKSGLTRREIEGLSGPFGRGAK
jgi:hypothetical protein